MPIYNGEKYLRQSLDSVFAQTFTDFELIAVNDGSRDNSLAILRSYNDPRLVIIDNGVNKSLITSLNIGLAKARGKYVARLDQDDIALPERFAVQYEYMEKHPEIEVVGSWTECIDTNGTPIKISRNQTEPIAIRYEFLFNNVMFHSSIFFRTDVVRGKGGYNDEGFHAEDYEMYSRPGKELICANIPRVLFQYRIHGESITGSNATLPVVHSTALKLAHRNISVYFPISKKEFDLMKDLVIIKKPNSQVTFSTLLLAMKILKGVTRGFISKNNLSSVDQILVLSGYRGRKNMIIKHYLIGKYRALFGKK